MNEQKETILITGSSGRIGYPLAKRFAESFYIVGFDRIASVIHLAAYYDFSGAPGEARR